MAAFSRTVLPIAWTPPVLPGALISIGASGKPQIRVPLRYGRTWLETFPPILLQSAVERGWYSRVQQIWRTGEVVTIQHRSYLTQNGAGGGTPVVNGATQTGNNIVTNGWPNSTTVLKAGDLVRLGALSPVFEITSDVTSDGSGNATLPIEPLVVSGSSPATLSSVLYGTGVTFNVIISNFDPGRTIDGYVDGIQVEFTEVL